MSVRTILTLAANPKDTPRLRLDEECRRIDEAIERSRLRDEFKVVPKSAVTDDDLRRALLDHKPEVVHFLGHAGSFGLEFENEHGYSLPIQGRALADLFKLCSGHVRCVVLNACHSAPQASVIAEHIEYVIGMSDSIGDQAAIKFSQGFYDGIAGDRGFEDAFELGRNAIHLCGIPEHRTPVLYKRSAAHHPNYGGLVGAGIDQLDAVYATAASQGAQSRDRVEWTPDDIEAIRSQVWKNIDNLGHSAADCPIEGFPLKVTLKPFESCDADISAYCERHGYRCIEKGTDPLRPGFEGKSWKEHHIKGMAEIVLKGIMVNCPVCGTVVRSRKDAGFVWLNCLRCGQHGEVSIR